MPKIAVGVLVNRPDILAANLVRSPDLGGQRIPLITEADPPSAAAGLNRVIERSQAEVVVCAHQDVFFPEGWFDRLRGAIEWLERRGLRWGVLGIVGATRSGEIIGRCYSVGLGSEVGRKVDHPEPAISLDECVLVIHAGRSQAFDEALPGFHLYGTDIVLQNLEAQFPAFVIDCPVIHNSLPVESLGGPYSRAYSYLRAKWREKLPIPTTVVPITALGWPLLRWKLRRAFSRAVPHARRAQRHPAPELLASTLGYFALPV